MYKPAQGGEVGKKEGGLRCCVLEPGSTWWTGTRVERGSNQIFVGTGSAVPMGGKRCSGREQRVSICF